MISNNNIYIDYDSTLNNLCDEWIKWINKKFNTKYTVEDITHWDWFGDRFGVEAYTFLTTDIFDNDIIKPKENSQLFINILKSCYGSDRIFIISDTPNSYQSSKANHIKRHYKISDSNIIFTKDKHKYTKDGILIDDKLENVIDHCLHNNKMGVVFSYKWNDYLTNPLVKIEADMYEKIKSNLYREDSYFSIMDLIL
jgi:5'(3')-deoxyribonucleotidase